MKGSPKCITQGEQSQKLWARLQCRAGSSREISILSQRRVQGVHGTDHGLGQLTEVDFSPGGLRFTALANGLEKLLELCLFNVPF